VIEARNTLIRTLLFAVMAPVGGVLRWWLARSLPGRAEQQDTLRNRYGITADAPIVGYTEDLRASVRASGERIVTTSGSTAAPKELAYPRARTRMVRLGFARVTLRSTHARAIRRPMIFTLASLSEDGSLTEVMTGGSPTLIDTLVTPHRILSHPAFVPLAAQYGLDAVRVWALILSSTGWLYATNPSTIAVFFHNLAADWDGGRAMLSDWLARPEAFSPDIHRQARRIVAPGWRARAEAAMAAPRPLPVTAWLPDLEAFSCWDGGNTGPFLTQVRTALPGATFVPMFSMSTETIETLTVYRGEQAHFLPIAPGVLYEFLPDGAEDDPSLLVGPADLTVGSRYTMVVSDAWGLRRYQTEDVFVCVAMVDGLPDLRFLHRRGLTWSFTGEKLCGEQLTLAYAALVADDAALAEVSMTCVPSHPDGARLPGYRLVLAVPGGVRDVDADLAERFDAHLRRINDEYDSKRKSDRLTAPIAVAVDYDALAAALRGESEVGARGWDSQFKLLPLLRRTWEELGL
jgi:hypothetical protein